VKEERLAVSDTIMEEDIDILGWHRLYLLYRIPMFKYSTFLMYLLSFIWPIALHDLPSLLKVEKSSCDFFMVSVCSKTHLKYIDEFNRKIKTNLQDSLAIPVMLGYMSGRQYHSKFVYFYNFPFFGQSC
jgi:hypothetical protein